MPRFLVPIFVLTSLSVAGFGYVILRLSPNQIPSVILFLVAFLSSLALGLSLLFFFVHKKFFFEPKTFTAFGPLITNEELRLLFRTSLRRAVGVAVLATTLLVLRRLW